MVRLDTRKVLHIGILKLNPPIHTAECSVQPSTTKHLLKASPTPCKFAPRVPKIHQLIIKHSPNKLLMDWYHSTLLPEISLSSNPQPPSRGVRKRKGWVPSGLASFYGLSINLIGFTPSSNQ
ncbi:hypothetical protein Salat_2578900 [Sesamum alatum]|uniref:Uncharacterized protein n=1 Tax=Sesamum alatum TaxID=300844 RepID=A0AAE1XMQ7_9LAMI|nr:hypothetical protein Salat_2578900 [Sesamum alatum]